ncbi:hypothetical protein CEXT_504651 [Caerostris extrusa]|uniref:Uncharacterized protein n=1 Tax=Caerostris extrusa TaxID=172846 RepID=A0AAV4W4I1_CAEEX|nr:hypothetical protein CEXT_504651 [Caerostris extrusa]
MFALREQHCLQELKDVYRRSSQRRVFLLNFGCDVTGFVWMGVDLHNRWLSSLLLDFALCGPRICGSNYVLFIVIIIYRSV